MKKQLFEDRASSGFADVHTLAALPPVSAAVWPACCKMSLGANKTGSPVDLESPFHFCLLTCESGGNRTHNLWIKSPLLCQLSYAPELHLEARASTDLRGACQRAL